MNVVDTLTFPGTTHFTIYFFYGVGTPLTVDGLIVMTFALQPTIYHNPLFNLLFSLIW